MRSFSLLPSSTISRLAAPAVLPLVALTLLAAGPAEAVEYPALGAPPAGANDWSCRPTQQQPEPVVLVHGTFGSQTDSWNAMSARLVQEGYCVFALDYGNRATGPVEDSAAELSAFVDEVLSATGAAQVSMVGHSQGGMMPRYYIKNLGGGPLVEDLVGLAPSNHGTKNPGAMSSGGLCRSCQQQAWGSDFITALNSGDETPGEVDYTQVVTEYDEVVTPYTSGFLEPSTQSTNMTVQDSCPADPVEHLGIGHDPVAIAWTLNALGRPGPADPQAAIGCERGSAGTRTSAG